MNASIDINSQGRFAHIDALRAFAVMLVVLNHAGLLFVPGQSGVTIFFAISGFIITHIVLREMETTGGFRIGRFYTNRAVKLAPPLLALILVPTAVYSIFHAVNWWVVSSQVFFSFNWVRIYDPASAELIMPGSGVTWSLAVEEQFYIGFALLWIVAVRFRSARHLLAVVAVAAILLSTTLRFALPYGDGIFFVRSTITRLDSIAWGVLTAVLYSFWRQGGVRWLGRLTTNWTIPAAAVLYFGSAAVPTPLSYTCQTLASIAVILWGLLPGSGTVRNGIYAFSRWKPIETLGLASYSIYLGHALVVFWLVPLFADALPTPVTIALNIVLGTLLGVAVWKWVELPVLAWRRKRIDPKFRARTAPPLQAESASPGARRSAPQDQTSRTRPQSE